MGAPIDVPRITNPTREDIENLHEKYVTALRELYDKYRYKYSHYPDTDLVIN